MKGVFGEYKTSKNQIVIHFSFASRTFNMILYPLMWYFIAILCRAVIHSTIVTIDQSVLVCYHRLVIPLHATFLLIQVQYIFPN